LNNHAVTNTIDSDWLDRENNLHMMKSWPLIGCNS